MASDTEVSTYTNRFSNIAEFAGLWRLLAAFCCVAAWSLRLRGSELRVKSFMSSKKDNPPQGRVDFLLYRFCPRTVSNRRDSVGIIFCCVVVPRVD